MNISISLIKNVATGIICLGLVVYSFYLGYGIFFKKVEVSTDVSTVNAGLLGQKLQKAALFLNSKTEKVSFSKTTLLFSQGALYKSFINVPEAIPLSDKRGREDPFVPYAP